MNMKRAMMIAVLGVAVAALAVPLVGLNARAAGSAVGAKSSVAAAKTNAAVARAASQEMRQETQQTAVASTQDGGSGKISADTVKALGLKRVAKNKLAGVAGKAAQQITANTNPKITPLPPGGRFNAPAGAGNVSSGPPLVGQPVVLNVNDALSAALITTIGGRDNQFSEVALIADWDGREDCAADDELRYCRADELQPGDRRYCQGTSCP